MFSPIFVADTKTISRHDFVAPFKFTFVYMWTCVHETNYETKQNFLKIPIFKILFQFRF